MANLLLIFWNFSIFAANSGVLFVFWMNYSYNFILYKPCFDTHLKARKKYMSNVGVCIAYF